MLMLRPPEVTCASTGDVPATLRKTLPANWPGLSPESARLPGSQATLVRATRPPCTSLWSVPTFTVPPLIVSRTQEFK